METTPISLITTLSFSEKIYKQLIPVAVHRTDPLAITFNPLYLFLVLYLAKIINKTKALVYDYL